MKSTPEKLAYAKAYRQANKEKIKLANQKWREENLEYHRRRALEYYYENREEVIKKNSARNSARRKTDLQYRLQCNLRSRLSNALRGRTKNASAIKDLGCSTEELKTYLASKFTGEMSWDNYGTVWEIDHIRPLANYDLTDREVVLMLVHFTNLQPMLIQENKRKSNKVI